MKPLVQDISFYPEDEGSMFLRKLVFTYQTTRSYNPTDHNMNLHRCESPKSYKPSVSITVKAMHSLG
jgi:hypothetical protein